MLFENKPIKNAILVIQPKNGGSSGLSATVMQNKREYDSASLRSQNDVTDELSNADVATRAKPNNAGNKRANTDLK